MFMNVMRELVYVNRSVSILMDLTLVLVQEATNLLQMDIIVLVG